MFQLSFVRKYECKQYNIKAWIFSIATLKSSEKHDNQNFVVFVGVKKGWRIAESVRNIIPVLMAVLKHYEILRNISQIIVD